MNNLDNLDRIERQIKEELESFIGNVNNWDSEDYWSKEIKEILYRIAKRKENNFHVAASDIINKDSGEWLYDLVWYNYGQGFLEDVHLVVESEWNKSREAIQVDFEKLIVAKARRHLMIFQAKKEQLIKEHIAFFNTIVDDCKLSIYGDRYLYAAYNIEEKRFFFDLKIK